MARPGVVTVPIGEQIVRNLDERSNGPHPLADPAFPFRVRIMVRDPSSKSVQQRPGVFRGNDMYVPLNRNEVYQIYVENHSGQPVLMRLLVDGLNTTLERETDKGITVEATAAAVRSVVAKRVNLDEARWWVLDPRVSEQFAVRGFVTSIGAQGAVREFRVVDAQASLAGRQQFLDQVGLITAAFYAPAADTRSINSIGTALGESRAERIDSGESMAVGNLLAVVHIHYVEPSALSGN